MTNPTCESCHGTGEIVEVECCCCPVFTENGCECCMEFTHAPVPCYCKKDPDENVRKD